MPRPQPLSVLISDSARERWGAAIEQHVQKSLDADQAADQTVQWVSPQSSPDAAGHYPCQVAYITRDITGASTKTRVLQDLQCFYEVMRASPHLAWVHVHSAGADRPIFAELRQRGIKVSTSSGANAQPVAHTALGAVLALGRRFPYLWAAQQAQRWAPLVERPDVHDLTGQTAMVVGMGRIGAEIARMLLAIGMNVVGVSRTNALAQTWPLRCTYADMAVHLPSTHYLILACPLSPLTHQLVNAHVLSSLPHGACVINVARGEVVDQAALIQALQSGHLHGAFLDVFETEPLDTASPLWRLPNVIISPHTAGHFAEHAERVQRLFLDNLSRFLSDTPLHNEYL
ncbi:MAG: D-2-hydroxyacid dehydrogenase [Betaproteobacteria bacterium]|nr:D-2-hydroxyacid dehydrogenase [Betaproteobacteria bacterium]